MDLLELANKPIPYAVTRMYRGGVQRYLGDAGYCDLIASEITPDNSQALEARLIAEASAALGHEVQIAETVRCIDMQFGEVLRVLFKPAWAGQPAAHLLAGEIVSAPMVAAA